MDSFWHLSVLTMYSSTRRRAYSEVFAFEVGICSKGQTIHKQTDEGIQHTDTRSVEGHTYVLAACVTEYFDSDGNRQESQMAPTNGRTIQEYENSICKMCRVSQWN